jgi:hypothetical protein
MAPAIFLSMRTGSIITGYRMSVIGVFNGATGGAPSQGIIWDLGGQANQAVVFVMVDHGPVPQEVWRTQHGSPTTLTPRMAGGHRPLLTCLRLRLGSGPGNSDGFVAVYTPLNAATFRYVSVTCGPGAIQRDGDNEIDAVGGLNAGGGGVVPEPSSLVMLASGLASLFLVRRRVRS